MMRPSSQLVLAAALLLAAGNGFAAEPAAPVEPLFSRHVVPVLSKLGCNAGACHGMVQGKGGFRLSLFGVDPHLDHERLLKETAGRRLNRNIPDASLILLKATGQVPHEGGQRTAVGSPEYQILRNWIIAGARLDAVEKSNVTRMIVTPATHTAKPKDRFALKAEVAFADGSMEDVTGLCVFDVGSRDVAEVDSKGRVDILGIGDTSIIVRYPGQVGMATLVVTPGKAATDFPAIQEHNFIDKHILARLKALDIHPSNICDDATFLRRVTLDVTGALPTPDEIRTFLADANADKRVRKITELLGRSDYAALWATKFMDTLRVTGFQPASFPPLVHEEYRAYEWLRARMTENLPYDVLVERILTATSREGRSLDEWAKEAQQVVREEVEGQAPKTYAARKTLDLFWQRRMATDVDHAIRVGHSFLGLRLQCAQCHRHPNDIWTQDDLLSFANFFMRVPQFTGLGGPRAKAEADVAALQKRLAKDLPMKAQSLFSKQFGDKEIWVLTKKDLDGPGMKGGRSFFNSGQKATGDAIVTSPLGTQTSQRLRFLGEKEPLPAVPDTVDRRQLVVDWLRRPDNPFFAKAIVNRVWAHYFDRGIVDPPDDLTPLNPASHPELLHELCAGFIKNKYDLKWLHSTIMMSRTYQQSSQTNASNKHDRRNFASFPMRRLSAEIVLDCFDQAVGVKPGSGGEKSPTGMPSGIRLLEGGSIFYRRNSDTSFALDTFGRPERDVEVVCDCERESQATMLQALYFANHPQARKKVADPNGRLQGILKKYADESDRVNEVFLVTVSRLPSAGERKLIQEYLRQSPTPQRGFEGVMWSLLNSNEFLFNR